MSWVGHDPSVLPAGLPVPVDDGAAEHLVGARMPAIALSSTDGEPIRLDHPSRQGGANTDAARLVVYAYPRTGVPDVEPLVPEWDTIPGARGCTPESCGFRDHAAELAAAGVTIVGLSTQHPDYQREAAERLRLPFPLVSDADLLLTRALDLPTFVVAGETLLRRFTLVVRDGFIEHVCYPVFPPDDHATEVLAWLRAHPA